MPIPIATGGASPNTVESWIRDIQHNQHMTQQMNAINRLPAERGGSGEDFKRERSRGSDSPNK